MMNRLYKTIILTMLCLSGLSIQAAKQCSLQSVPFCSWNGWGTDARSTGTADCNWVIGESTDLPYGDVSVINYADLSAFSSLIVKVSEGTPRMLFNRDVDEGQWDEVESQSHLIDNTRVGWSDRYFSVDGNTYTVDLARMKAEKGYAHLHAIKGGDWVNVTVTEMVLVSPDNTIDMTSSIINPDFEDGPDAGSAQGWTIDRTYDGGNVQSGPYGEGYDQKMIEAIGKTNHCFESWRCHDFDVWQELTDLPAGVYSLSLQGYVRCEIEGYTWGEDFLPDHPSPFYVYMNDATAKFPNVFSQSLEELGHTLTYIEDWTVSSVNDKQYPNSIGAAAQCFGWGMYKVELIAVVNPGETVRIGVKGKTDEDWWCAWDNFQLTYLGDSSPDGSTERLVNGNFEGDDVTCFMVRNGDGVDETRDDHPAEIQNGIGYEGSRGVCVHAVDNPPNEWDAQFFIYTPNFVWKAGQHYRFSFKARADKPASISVQSHTTPSDYIFWSFAGGGYDITTDWKSFEYEGVVTEEQTEDRDLQTIAFNLSVLAEANTYYFDDISWKTISEGGEPEPVTDLPEGNYYLKNVETGKYWGAANDWGTRASLVKNPEYITLHKQPDGKYMIETQYVDRSSENCYFNGEYMDHGPGEAPLLTITKMDDGTYTIANGDSYYGYDGNSSVLGKELDAQSRNARWQILNEAEMLETLDEASAENPVDATFLIGDPNFSRNHRRAEAWTMEADNQNLCGGEDTNRCAESWHSAFTLCQQIKNVPNGYYGLIAQGFYRQDGEDNDNLPYFYINDQRAQFYAMGELPDHDGDGGESMGDVSVEFSNGAYTIRPIYVKVTDGTITLGARLENNTGLWAIWDNFELYYYGDSEYPSDFVYKEFSENTVLLTTIGEIESQKQQQNWIDGGTYQAIKNGTINPANGQEGEGIVTEGILLKSGNSQKSFQTYVTGIEGLWAYGCTAGGTGRDLVVNVYDRNDQLVASNKATTSEYKSVVVEIKNLNPAQQYKIDYLGCNEGSSTGADVVLHGVKFLKKYYTDKTFVYNKLRYHTTSNETVEVIGNDGSLSGIVYIPSKVASGTVVYSVTSIAAHAFQGLDGITSVSLPASVTYIGYQAFASCGNCTSVTIPANVATIEDQAFVDCQKLTAINVASDNQYYCSIDGVLYTRDMKRLVGYPAGKEVNYFTIPEGVETLGTSCLANCNKLESVTIPASFKAIWWRPFENSENLTTVTCLMEKPFEDEYDEYMFNSQTYEKATLWVPRGCSANYRSRSPWNKFKSIRELPSQITVSVKDRTMTYGDNPPTDFEMEATEGPLAGTPKFVCDVKKTTSAGTYDITIQDGSLYSPVPLKLVPGKMTVEKATLTATVGNYERNMGENNPTFTIKFTGFRNGDGEQAIKTKPRAVCTATPQSPAGNYPITLEGGEADNYKFTYVNGELTVHENYILTITVLGNGTVTYNGKTISTYEQFSLPAGSSITLSFAAGTNCLLSQATMNGADIMKSIKSNRYVLYNIRENVNVVVGYAERGTINIAAHDYTMTYGDDLPSTFEYSVIGGTVSGTPSLTCVATKKSPVGTYDIIVGKGTLSSTDKLTYTKGTLTILPAPLTARVGNYQRYKGQNNPQFEVTYEGFRNGEDASVLTKQPVPSCSAGLNSPAGRYPITLSGGSAKNYTFNYVEGELTVIANHLLIISPQGHGYVKYDNYNIRTNRQFEVTPGSDVVLTFIPDEGYYLSELTLNGRSVLSSVVDNTYTITKVSQDMSLIAQFSERVGDFIEDGISYTITSSPNKTVAVAQGTYNGHIKIPERINHDGQTWSVEGIQDNAFNSCTQLLTIELPNTLKASEIGISLFTGCANLAAIIWNANSALTQAQLGVVNNQNLLFYTKSKSYVPEGIVNVVVNEIAEKIVLIDGSEGGGNFYCPIPFTAKTVSYSHTYSMESAIGGVQGWETLALPFTVQRIEHSREGTLTPFASYDPGQTSARPFWLYTYDDRGFFRYNQIEANRAFIVCMPNNREYDSEYCLNGKVTYSAQNTRVEASSWNYAQKRNGKELCPIFCYQNQSDNVYALNVVNDMHNETGGYTPGSIFIRNLRGVSPFEACFITSSSNAREVIDIEFVDATGIDELPISSQNRQLQHIYSLTGQLLYEGISADELQKVMKRLPKGVYIVNGKKQQIK